MLVLLSFVLKLTTPMAGFDFAHFLGPETGY